MGFLYETPFFYVLLRSMKKQHWILVTIVIFAFGTFWVVAQPSRTNNYSSFKKDIQRQFAEEVAGKKNIAEVSQTARFLGLLEFMDPTAFPALEGCFKKYQKWGSLSATKREQAIDSCRTSMRGPAMPKHPLRAPASVGPPPAASRQALNQISGVNSRLDQILAELRDLDNQVNSLQDGQRDLRDSISSSAARTPATAGNEVFEEEVVE